jgi:hypothetical protein
VPTVTLFDDVLIAAGITWLIARQFWWRDVAGLLRLPLILLVVGGCSIGADLLSHGEHISSIGVTLLVAELLLVATTGAVMGTRYQFRTTCAETQCRLDATGLLLWAVFLGIRISSLILASQVGAKLLESTGVVLVSFATNRLAASVLVLRRAQQREVVRDEYDAGIGVRFGG